MFFSKQVHLKACSQVSAGCCLSPSGWKDFSVSHGVYSLCVQARFVGNVRKAKFSKVGSNQHCRQDVLKITNSGLLHYLFYTDYPYFHPHFFCHNVYGFKNKEALYKDLDVLPSPFLPLILFCFLSMYCSFILSGKEETFLIQSKLDLLLT